MAYLTEKLTKLEISLINPKSTARSVLMTRQRVISTVTRKVYTVVLEIRTQQINVLN
jgi:hypothetical protein